MLIFKNIGNSYLVSIDTFGNNGKRLTIVLDKKSNVFNIERGKINGACNFSIRFVE